MRKYGTKVKQLTAEENIILVELVQEIKRLTLVYGKKWPKYSINNRDIQHAFGIGRSKVQKCVQQFNNRNFSANCQKRSDAGLTVFNSQCKRNSTYTALHYYRKAQRIRHRERISEDVLIRSFNNLTPEVKQQCEIGALELKTIVSNIRPEIEKVLQRRNGVISWKQMAQTIAGGEREIQPVSKEALQKQVMSSIDFCYMTTQTLPQCTSNRIKKWRYRWSISFNLF